MHLTRGGGLGEQDGGRQLKHRLEVDQLLVPAERFVCRVQPSGVLDPGRRRPLGLRRREHVGVGVDLADLRPLDLGHRLGQRGTVHAHPQAPHGFAQQRQLRLHEPRRPPADHPGPEVGELPQCRRVERGRAYRLRAAAERAQPASQLPCCPDRERQREHVRRVDRPRRDRIGDAVGDRPGLARPRAGQHAHRPRAGQRYRPLLGVERCEQLVGVHPSYGAARHRLPRPRRGK